MIIVSDEVKKDELSNKNRKKKYIIITAIGDDESLIRRDTNDIIDGEIKMGENKPVTMKAKQAAEYLGISYWKILDLAKKNMIPHIDCGKKLFRKESLDKWMAEQENKHSTNAKGSCEEKTEGYGTLRKIY